MCMVPASWKLAVVAAWFGCPTAVLSIRLTARRNLQVEVSCLAAWQNFKCDKGEGILTVHLFQARPASTSSPPASPFHLLIRFSTRKTAARNFVGRGGTNKSPKCQSQQRSSSTVRDCTSSMLLMCSLVDGLLPSYLPLPISIFGQPSNC
ncbi:hypothetical protein B0T13DRAFT_71483 [Neurospora crassa]|nr:hypothetical protein B0T13DRAFT_71483 [Neurospora crassa]